MHVLELRRRMLAICEVQLMRTKVDATEQTMRDDEEGPLLSSPRVLSFLVSQVVGRERQPRRACRAE